LTASIAAAQHWPMGDRRGTPLVMAALDELSARVRERFADRVRQLQLFGSWARGEATEDSDVDVLVVIDDLSSDELYDVVALGAEIATRRNVLLRPLAMSSSEFDTLRDGDRLLYREIARDGVPL
jgi:predicted nucleotidyltransferase